VVRRNGIDKPEQSWNNRPRIHYYLLFMIDYHESTVQRSI
jgi:hypothetical protein